MIIVCPQCESRYAIGEDHLLDAGRQVRCARCRAEWIAYPAEDDGDPTGDSSTPAEAEPAGVEILEEEEAPGAVILHGVPDIEARGRARMVGDGAPESIEEIAARTKAPLRATAVPRRRRLRLPPIRPLVIVLGLAASVACVTLRAQVVNVLPATASLYALLGLPVNLRGLAFESVATSRATEGDAPVLVIDGSIRNVVGRAQPVPRLRFAISDEKKVEVYSWTIVPARSVLESGDAMPFKSRLASPPANGRTVSVRFVRREDLVAGVE